ncbi:MAG TPA: hypothetical protein VK993_04325 [Chthoniobacterales bacterium]|nr:hypothetical protein [Chthoniobacterales bacterium]
MIANVITRAFTHAVGHAYFGRDVVFIRDHAVQAKLQGAAAG